MTKVKQPSQIRSMTGFGKARTRTAGVTLDVEVKSVNHRFLEFSSKLPKVYSGFESEVRRAVADKVQRGKVDVLVSRTATGESGAPLVTLNKALFQSYLSVYNDAFSHSGASLSGESQTGAILSILSRTDVVSGNEDEPSILLEKDTLLATLNEALNELVRTKVGEGERILTDLKNRIASLLDLRKKLQDMSAVSPSDIKDRLTLRLKKLAPEISVDEARLAQEVALLADRADVTEELVRLDSHLSEISTVLFGSVNGKRIDFLLQECGREFNTIGSKAQNAPIQSCVVSAKMELEKLREQIQNIE